MAMLPDDGRDFFNPPFFFPEEYEWNRLIAESCPGNEDEESMNSPECQYCESHETYRTEFGYYKCQNCCACFED